MLPDTSIARMMVSCCDGSVTTAVGPRDRHEHQRQREQEQHRRHVPAQPLAGAHRLLDHRQAGIAQRRLLAAGAAAST